MDVTGYIQGIVTGAIALAAVWGFLKVIKEIKKDNDTEHDKRQRWDKTADVLEQKAELWDKGLADMEEGRKKIVARYDMRLSEQDAKLDNQDAKIQQLLSMLCMTLRAQDAILEALVEQGIGNGEIKAMHKELKGFILDQVQ